MPDSMTEAAGDGVVEALEPLLAQLRECERFTSAPDWYGLKVTRGQVRKIAAAAQALRPEPVDNPEFDATDGAHPAWWRGHDHTAKVFCDLVTKILDGEDDGGGFNNEPWGTLRRRLLALQSPAPVVSEMNITPEMIVAGRDALYRRRYDRLAAMFKPGGAHSLSANDGEIADDARACIRAALAAMVGPVADKP